MAKLKDIFVLITLVMPFIIYFIPVTHSSSYPIAIGNEWKFESDNNIQTIQIVDMVTINDKVFYIYVSDQKESEFVLREENDVLFCLNLKDSSEFVLYNFTMEPGDSIMIPDRYKYKFGNKIFLLSKTDQITTPAGSFYNCYHFKHQINCLQTEITDIWFSMDAGIVKYISESNIYKRELLLTDYSLDTMIGKKSGKLLSASTKTKY